MRLTIKFNIFQRRNMQKKNLKLLMLTTILIFLITLIPFQQCRSQTIIDNNKLRDALKLIEMGKIDREKVKLYQEQVIFLNERIAIKDSIIRTYNLKDSSHAKIIETYKSEVENLKAQKNIITDGLTRQNKLMKRQKIKTVFIAIAGPALTTAVFIYLKK